MSHISRREFVAMTVAGAAATPFALTEGVASAASVTAQDIVDRIERKSISWPSTTSSFSGFTITCTGNGRTSHSLEPRARRDSIR
jgi:hypothetical protein